MARDARDADHSIVAIETEAIARRGLRDDVHDRILQLLLDGKAAPGARLPIDGIARQLGVSPTPVREALVQLERTGLVEREALKGYRVAPPLEREQMAELFDAREMLEGTAARMAGSRTDALLPELKVAYERHRVAGEAVISALDAGASDIGLLADYYARDRDFHNVILRYSGNRYFVEISNSLGALLHRLRQSLRRGVTDVREALDEHGEILDAYVQGNAELAERAMRTHIRNVRNRSLRYDE